MPLAAPLQADEGVDAAGQIFLRFNFGDKVRDAGPRFGLRLGALPEPELNDAAAPDFTEDFTSAFDLSLDDRGRGELSLGGIRMIGIGGHDPAVPGGHGTSYDAAAVLGYAASGRAMPQQLESAPLVTAAGPAGDGTARTTPGAESLLRQAAADPAGGPERWAFHAVRPGAQAMGPRFRRLAANLLQRRHDATTPVTGPAKSRAPDDAAAATTRWQFHAIEAVAPTAAESSLRGAIAGHAALLLAPHGQGVRQAAGVTAAGPQTHPLEQAEQAAAAAPRQAAGRVAGQWIFRNLSGATAG